MPHQPDSLTLVADIGGTNTRVALARGREVMEGTARRYLNAEHDGLGTVLRRFVEAEAGVDPAAACVAVAGPVRDGRATLTNLDWTIDIETLGRAVRADTVAILNDLQAQGHALGHIAPNRLRSIVVPEAPVEGDTRLVVGVGTGFNVAPVFDFPGGRLVPPAEAGHVTLPIRDTEGLGLGDFVAKAHGFPAVEDVLSGRGIERLYAWLGQSGGQPREATADEIMRAVEAGGDDQAVRTARVFARLLGEVVGNLALTLLPVGGIWLSGGVARAMGPHLRDFGFVEGLRDKGRFSDFMKQFSVGVIEDDFAALTGCASHLVDLSGAPARS